ncbi:F-box only protein 46 [Festucalex cinctus]
MDRDTFSHIRLWCPRPFGTYSQNKARNPGTGGNVRAVDGAGSSSLSKGEPPPSTRSVGDGAKAGGILVAVKEDNIKVQDVGSENTPPEPELKSSSLMQSQPAMPTSSPSPLPSSGTQMEDGRVLLDTWYVIKPGNTKEKIAFFVAHQFSGAGQPRPSAMKVKGNWATDCSKAKRRRRCSSYDPPNRMHASEMHLSHDSSEASNTLPSPDQLAVDGANKTDLLSVAQMVALVEQRTAMDLRNNVGVHGNQHQPSISSQEQGLIPHQHTLLRGTVSDPSRMSFMSDSSKGQLSKDVKELSTPIETDQDLEEQQQESCRVAQAIAHFESQNLENRLRMGTGSTTGLSNRDGELRGGAESSHVAPCPPHSQGEVRIAFRVSNLDPHSQLEPAGRSRCMFMSCGGGSSQAAARSKEKITCDLYQLVSPSSRDPSSLLLATSTPAPKLDGDLHHYDRQTCGSLETSQEPSSAEKISVGVGRERVTGFHVEVVVSGAVDQCVFYGKDSTENVQEETVCFAMPGGGGSVGGVPNSTEHSSEDPPPGQLVFLPSPRVAEEESNATSSGRGSGLCSLDCANNSSTPGTGQRMTGFHVEVVVSGAVDQCVFYGKDSTETVQEEAVCFAMPGGGGSGVPNSTDHSSEDPPPGQLFFLPSPRVAEEELNATISGRGSGLCSLDCANSSSSSPVAGLTCSGERAPRPDSPLASVGEDCSDPSLCRLYRHVSHDFLEIRFQIQRLLEPRQYMLLLPDHIMVNILSYLPTRSLAALKCTCHYFKSLIETYGVRAVDSRWNQDPLYRDDPCKQCKRQYERGDVSLCRWHPKPYHHDLPYGRSYWMCCRRTDKDTPGCRVGLHDNNWVQQPADGSQPIRSKKEVRREEAR